MQLTGSLPTTDELSPSQFLRDSFALYKGHRGLFLRILLPAIVLGYLAVMAGNNNNAELLAHIPRGPEAARHMWELIRAGLAKLAGFFVSWILYCYAYAATCVAVTGVETGEMVDAEDSYARVRERIGRFLGLSVVLFLFVCLAGAILVIVAALILYVGRKAGIPISNQSLYTVAALSLGVLLLGVSRLGLSLPAIVLDGHRVVKSLFLSDELTESRTLILVALLIEGVGGTYFASVVPYWLAGFVWHNDWPSWSPWALHAISLGAAAFVQPGMFIGLALLYRRTQDLRLPSDLTPLQ